MLYAVLAPVSSCYSPLTGRLLTRYSPVRHWSILPKGCISPFDLNVLCTPPALILSQDQTLHNISLLRRFIRISSYFSGSLRIWQEFLLVHFLSLLLFNFQRPSSASSATAFLLYHHSSPLSSTFFAFFYFFLMPPLHLYSYISFMYVLNCFFGIFIILYSYLKDTSLMLLILIASFSVVILMQNLLKPSNCSNDFCDSCLRIEISESKTSQHL